LDYLSAYLDFYTGYPKFEIARDISLKYLDYPILSWRALFIEIANQLGEFDGDEMISDSLIDETKANENIQNAEKEENIKLEIKDSKLYISQKNVREAKLSFYVVELEILFSRNPFFSQLNDDFTFLKPNHVHALQFKEQQQEDLIFEIPPTLQKSNLFIQLRSDNKFSTVSYFASSFVVEVIENYGHIKVLTHENKPIKKAYIKCFVKTKSGNVNFYKDGYTDIRGRFDYAALNSSKVSDIEKFAIFVSTEEEGSVIKEANPPNMMSKIDDIQNNIWIKSKNPKYEKYQNDPFQQQMIKKFNKMDL
jgi:hypothetical protein